MPAEPLPLLVVDTTSAPRSRHRYRPVDRSHQQSTATLSLMSHGRCEGQSAGRMVGEKCLVNGTYPHITPVVFETTVDTPALATTSPHTVTVGPA